MMAKLDQNAQKDWYYAGGLLIAKKGSPIVIEEVSYELSDSLGDWGGVSEIWWAEATDRFLFSSN